MSNVHTFSIGFNGKYDETEFINIAKDKFLSKHTHEYFSKLDYIDLRDKYTTIYDEPFADYSSFPTYTLSKLSSEKVKVCLSGDGGDEIFGGYNKYLNLKKILRLRNFPLKTNIFLFHVLNLFKKNSDRSKLGKAREALRLSMLPDSELLYKKFSNYNYISETVIDWFENNFKRIPESYPIEEAYLKFDLLFLNIPDKFMTKVDRASMANSLEVRSPFLDYRLVEYSSKIPIEMKYNSNKSKILLKKIVNNLVPSEIINRKKQGFNPPLVEWVDSDYKSLENYVNFVEKLYKSNLITGTLNDHLMEIIKSSDISHKENLIKLEIFYKWFQNTIHT